MTKEQLIALINDAGGPDHVIAIILETHWAKVLYLDNDTHKFSLDDIVTIGGIDCLKIHMDIKDARPDKRITEKHPATMYTPVERIQGVMALDGDPKEKQVLDLAQFSNTNS